MPHGHDRTAQLLLFPAFGAMGTPAQNISATPGRLNYLVAPLPTLPGKANMQGGLAKEFEPDVPGIPG